MLRSVCFQGQDSPCYEAFVFRSKTSCREGVRKIRMSVEARTHQTNGTLWLGPSCPSASLQGQDCPCYAGLRGKSASAAQFLVAWTVLSKRFSAGTRLSLLRWLAGQECLCCAVPRGLDRLVQALLCRDRTVPATRFFEHPHTKLKSLLRGAYSEIPALSMAVCSPPKSVFRGSLNPGNRSSQVRVSPVWRICIGASRR
ncbi:MAG: hypothetical protein KatS3mg020_1020 [Fimbriimonadales bacterium]|nr:MAG: hypothetical protein KatS3mg020_1020 [Fimbriimonadales bacterium]